MMKAWSMPSGTRESISFRLGFTGTILPAYPCFLRKRCVRAVFFFSSLQAPRRFKGSQAHAAVGERGRDDILHREARLSRSARRFVMRDLQAGAVGTDAYALDLRRPQAHLRLEGERAVDSGEGMPAAGVVLERHARDVEVAAQRGERLLPVRTVCHRAPEAGLAFDDIERAGDAFARGERRGYAGLVGA